MTTVTPPHLGGSYVTVPDQNTWMPDVWSRLIDDYSVQSVIDLGCGAGWSTEWFAARVAHVLGVEGDPAALQARRCDSIVAHDYTLGPLTTSEGYDLCWCAEFVEHVEARFEKNWLATMLRCRYVCMTFAVPGQGGHHHVNEQPESYWLRRFNEAGFEHVVTETERLRATSRGEPWGRPTLTFFQNRART